MYYRMLRKLAQEGKKKIANALIRVDHLLLINNLQISVP